jgi:phosphotransferase system enzyme I (PtsP)
MPPAAVAPVKTMIRSLDVGHLARFLESCRGLETPSLRPLLTAYARDHGVEF